MIFWYSPLAGAKNILLEKESFHYLIRVRRHKKNDIITVQNGSSPQKYDYQIEYIEKKSAMLVLVLEQEINIPPNNIHICWGICDTKTIYDTIPSLVQLGVSKITFLRSNHSQHAVKLSFEKMQHICINAMQQCGQWKIPIIEEYSFLESIQKYNNKIMLDMSGKTPFSRKSAEGKSIYIGPEGGWSKEEKALFASDEIKSFSTELVLKSETATILAAGSMLME